MRMTGVATNWICDRRTGTTHEEFRSITLYEEKWIRNLETQEIAHTSGTYMNPSEWQSVGRDILVGLPGTAPLEES